MGRARRGRPRDGEPASSAAVTVVPSSTQVVLLQVSKFARFYGTYRIAAAYQVVVPMCVTGRNPDRPLREAISIEGGEII